MLRPQVIVGDNKSEGEEDEVDGSCDCLTGGCEREIGWEETREAYTSGEGILEASAEGYI